VAPGLYLTFFTEGEPPADELPAVGPFDFLVVRPGALVADRRSVSQTGDVGGAGWMEAERELQRALGYERGGARRPDLRIAAPEGVYLRFASFEGGEADQPVQELGPYAVIVVTRSVVAGDGEEIAARSSISDRAWVLRGGGPELVGIIRPDIAFRTRSTNYHPQIHQAHLGAQPGPASAATAAQAAPTVATPVVPPAAPVFRPSAAPVIATRAPPPTPAPSLREAVPALREAVDDRTPVDEVSPLHARLGGAPRTDPGATQAAPSAQELSRRNARWWAGVVLIGALVLGVGAFGAFALRGALTPGPTGISVVSIGKAVKGTQFDYTVASVSRTPTVGAARAQGTYLIVFVTLTHRGSDAATLSPTAFRLIDGGGAQYSALSDSDPIYRSGGNPGSPVVWMSSYPAGQAVITPVIFDVDATLRGVQLMILEVPTVRVRLD
jgi:hypothetical protein